MSTEALRPNEPTVTGQEGTGADPAEVGQVMGQLMADLAARSSAAEPYVREWLRSQAAAGYARYEPATGRFSLPAAMAAVMAADLLRSLLEGPACRRRRSGRRCIPGHHRRQNPPLPPTPTQAPKTSRARMALLAPAG